MKLSTIWQDFDEFSELCLELGTINTKYKMKKIKTFFDGTNRFDGNWQNLFNDIISIFVNDKRIAYKFNYSSKEFINRQQELLHKNNPTSYGVKKGLFDKLEGQFRNNQEWNSTNNTYLVNDYIYLTKKIPLKVEIVGSSLRKSEDIFFVNVDNNQIVILYKDNKYVNSTNSKTLRKVQISKYPEIIHFINAKYYKIFINNLSYNSFKYLVLSFSEIKNLRVPSNQNGYLSSSLTSQYIKSLEEANEYFKTADEKFENIRFSYIMTDYNRFEIIRPENLAIQKNIGDIENEYGDMKSKYPFSPRATERTFKK
jgi:hypothetical protein